jgi:hypothetical protein
MGNLRAPPKDDMVRFRVPASRKEIWSATAASEGMNLSEWLRTLAEIRSAELIRSRCTPR